MDTGGSFLDFACVRVALIPAGPTLSEQRFEELTLYLTWLREIPTGALPRRSAVPRSSTNATYSSMPAAYREAWGGANESLLRSRSSVRDASRGLRRSSLLSLKPVPSKSVSNLSATDTSSMASIKLQPTNPESVPNTPEGTNSSKSDGPSEPASSGQSSFEISSGVTALSVSRPTPLPRARTAPSVALGYVSELNLNCPEVDSCFRLRYEILHRDTFGRLVTRPPSEWDAFHSSRVWAVFAVADVTNCDSDENREQAIDEARQDFVSSLGHFRDAPVKRLIVFVPQNEERSRSFVEEEHLATERNGDIPIFYSVGYVPEQPKAQETKREVRAHLYQCASTLLSVIGRDCFKKQENSTELILSPIDERLGVDRQSKLSKRRPGRLDKMQGDYLLLMGRPGEALAKYNSAIDKAKSGGDRLWLAGAMEGWSAAHVLLHVGAGRSLNDAGFCNHLIDHYAEIFKLYQKKRVAEPEAAAALRLAEFLGRWTNRRKEALDAAEHAATIGEGLRAQKRAALWQALARFSERMGCRRKAGMYLYRLGHLNASQSVWPSAVALMSTAERQISPKGFKSWPDLSRKLLLTAANYAIEAGDSTTAARLYAEALIISPLSRKKRRETDEAIVKAMRKAHVPPLLPGIGGILKVAAVEALQAQDLFLRRKSNHLSSTKGLTPNGPRTGPFIYNAFEINEERRRAAAAARRSITWVRGEAAHISVSLFNRIATDIVIDLIAVLMSDENGKKDSFSQVIPKSSISLTESSSRIWVDEEQSNASHAAEIRRLLDESKRIVKTKSETMAIPSTEEKNGAMRHIEVVPKLTGSFYVNGLLVRLFDGILVILRPDQEKDESFQVNVIEKLPRITLTSYNTEGKAAESISPRKPLCVFHGESRSFLVEMKNTGPVKIQRVVAKIQPSHPDSLLVVKDDLAKHDIKEGLESHGDVKSFVVEILGKCPNVITDDTHTGEKPLLRGTVSKVSIQIEYEGEHSEGMVRESRSFVRINSKPAVVIRKVSIFHRHPLGNSPLSEEQRLSILAIEVSNEVAAPATIKVEPAFVWSKSPGGLNQRAQDSMDSILEKECFVESGASARLLCYVAHDTLNQIRTTSSRSSVVERTMDGEDIIFTVRWNLPALGRKGTLPFTSLELWKLLHRNYGTAGGPKREDLGFAASNTPIRAEIRMQIDDKCKRRVADNERLEGRTSRSARTKVQVGCFWTVQVLVRNLSEHQLAETCVLDFELKQLDSDASSERLHRASLVGVVERIFVGALMPNGEDFHHCIRVRVDSMGTFHLVAYLYEADSVSKTTRINRRASGLQCDDGDSERSSKTDTGLDIATQTKTMNKKSILRSTGSNSLEPSPSASATNSIVPSDAISASGFQEKDRRRVHAGGIHESEDNLGVVIRPVTIDTYSNSSVHRIRGRPIAMAVLEFSTERKSDSNYFTRSTPYFDTMCFDEDEDETNHRRELDRPVPNLLYQSVPAKD